MHHVTALLALATLALIASPAQAIAPQPPPFPSDAPVVSTPLTRASLRIANRFWGENPCPGGVTVRIALLASGPDSPEGMAPVERLWHDHPCDLVLSPAIALRFPDDAAGYQGDIAECNYIVHWAGHALGYDHVADSRSIMYPAPSATVSGCYKRFKPKRVTIRRDRAFNERVFACLPLVRRAAS